MDRFVRIGGLESVLYSPYVYKWREYRAAVYKCRDTQTNETVVIKEVPDGNDFQGTPSWVDREIFYFKRVLAHDCIVRLLDIIEVRGAVYLVFENFNLSLRHLINRCYTFDSNQIKKILHKILLGVAHCHSKGIMHRHLEPKYVLLDLTNGTVKLSEFGEAMGAGLPCEKYKRLSYATPGYKAIEVLVRSRYYTKACDIWSVGCIFGEMVLQDSVFSCDNEFNALVSIFNLLGTPNQKICPELTAIWKGMPCFVEKEPQPLEVKFKGLGPTGVDLISKMLCLDPSKRISADDALNHEYFNDL